MTDFWMGFSVGAAVMLLIVAFLGWLLDGEYGP